MAMHYEGSPLALATPVVQAGIASMPSRSFASPGAACSGFNDRGKNPGQVSGIYDCTLCIRVRCVVSHLDEVASIEHEAVSAHTGS